MGLSPLTLFTLTLSVESGQSVDALVQRLKADVADLEANGALQGFGISSLPDIRAIRVTSPRRREVACPSSQAELCFAE